ncbi:MAG: hypothetical protein ACK2UB_10005 [Anaerolineales bacterium]
MERSLFLSAVDAALTLTAPEARPTGLTFARRASQEWLARWPGDYRVRERLAQACLLSGDVDSAVEHLARVIEADPETARPYRTVSDLLRRLGREDRAGVVDGYLAGMGAIDATRPGLPGWADPLHTAVRLMKSGRWQEARLATETVMRSAPAHPLPALLHLQSLWRLAQFPVVLSAGREYRTSWPGCSAFLLLMAQASFSAGKNAEGVEMLHAASVADPAGEVADRYLGALNPYRSLWPVKLEAELSIALPAEVASAAGWNRLTAPPPGPQAPVLPEDIPVLRFPDFDALHPDASQLPDVIAPIPGERYTGPAAETYEKKASAGDTVPVASPAHKPPVSDDTVPVASPAQKKSESPEAAKESDIEDLRRRLDQVAARLRMRKTSRRKDARRPAYVLLTSRKRLASIYGPDVMPQIDRCFRDLLTVKGERSGWSAYLADVDDSDSMKAFGLTPVDSANAWQVKTQIAGIDRFLAKSGEMIGAMLIVGGHEVIPFHLLPNPTDDDDADIPSDNPYASRDENYYVPEWPIGRIPTPSDSKAAFLLGVLRRAAEEIPTVSTSWMDALLAFLRNFLPSGSARFRKGSAVSAAVWRKAALDVFRPVASSSSMLVVPPADSRSLPAEFFAKPRYSYFNLHGLEHGPQWLGQREAKAKAPVEVEFPIALLPAQISGAQSVPPVVFTEACYGANILHKGIDDSICLEFLANGTRALAGSTKICYGAAASPLIAADLLARLFLQNCLSGIPAGESLRLAKLAFTEEMNRRQGFLDPEDQKTLTSFILLGDPMYVPENGSAKTGKQGISRWRKPPDQIKTLFAKEDLLENGTAPSPKIQASLKQAMERYLPGMTDSRMRYLHPRGDASAEGKSKSPPAAKSPAWVVAVDRKYEAHGHSLTQYAKISLDAAGRIVKMAVSR